MTIELDSKRRGLAAIRARHPGAQIVDVTSRGPDPWIRLSPFYPHGDIPVPISEPVTSQSVEGVWQALKVFERADVDPSKLENRAMLGIKRTEGRNGRTLGHRRGLHGADLLGYREARRLIYLPVYRWVLENKVSDLVAELRSAPGDVVLLDYSTNDDPEDVSAPLSHAGLVRRYVEHRWPDS